ncbi:MAG TPA: HEPN domain-containing protein [Actinospica sp.]|nr:HEPN domain-containing protein [Actinospica sp.]
MESFESEGFFWLPSAPDSRVIGRLVYNAAEGGTLTLFGSLSGQSVMFSNQQPPSIMVHGVASKEELTLLNCFSSGTQIEHPPGIMKETFHVGQVLTGAWFEDENDLVFDEFVVEFDQLSQWVGRTGLKLEADTRLPNDYSTLLRWRVTYDVLPDEEVQLPDGRELRLAFSWSINGDRVTSLALGQSTSLVLKYPECKPLEEVQTDLNGLQDLITLAMDAPALPNVVSLYRSDLTRELGSGRQVPVRIGYGNPNSAEHVREKEPQGKHKVFFPFADLGGVEAIGRWIDVSRTYRPVLGALLTLRYSARLYQENRYLNVLNAAETFHRSKFPNAIEPPEVYKARKRKLVALVKATVGRQVSAWLGDQLAYGNEPRLRRRLEELASYAGAPFAELVGDVSTWAEVATATRNRMTHNEDGLTPVHEPGDIYMIADSVYVLVMLCLLRECQVADQPLSKLSEANRMHFLRSKLVGAIDRCGASFIRGWEKKRARRSASGTSD